MNKPQSQPIVTKPLQSWLFWIYIVAAAFYAYDVGYQYLVARDAVSSLISGIILVFICMSLRKIYTKAPVSGSERTMMFVYPVILLALAAYIVSMSYV